jgi:hypothetical protein
VLPQGVLRRIFRGWLPVLLVILALGFAGFDSFVVRPAMVSLAATGRKVTGTVLSSGGATRIAFRRASSAIGVDDAELGWQLVDGPGGESVGARVAVLCSTPAGCCEPAARVSSYVARWPLSAGMIRAAALLSLAIIGAVVTRRRPTNEPSMGD